MPVLAYKLALHTNPYHAAAVTNLTCNAITIDNTGILPFGPKVEATIYSRTDIFSDRRLQKS